MPNTETREQRKWWVQDKDNNAVISAIGFSCRTEESYGVINENVWWFPSVGYSMTEGSGCFPSETEAKAALKKTLKAKIRNLEDRLDEAKEAYGKL